MINRPYRILIVAATAIITVAAAWVKIVRPGNYLADGWIILLIAFLLALEGAVRASATSNAHLGTLLGDQRFRQGFRLWFCIALGFFVLANVIGYSPGKIRFHGMPLEFYPTFGHEMYAGAAIALDFGIALGYSYLCGFGMAYHRASGNGNTRAVEARPSSHPNQT